MSLDWHDPAMIRGRVTVTAIVHDLHDRAHAPAHTAREHGHRAVAWLGLLLWAAFAIVLVAGAMAYLFVAGVTDDAA